MTSARRNVDAVVVGAGTAGANAAYQLAIRGMDTIILEKRDSSRAGAQWHNGVLDWQFEAAGIAPPESPERSESPGITHIFGPNGSRGVTVRDSPVARADMGLLGSRLRRLAEDAGVEILDNIGRFEVRTSNGRIVGIETPNLTIEAPLFVDASGRRGVLRRFSATLSRWCPDVRGPELCTATDFHLAVADKSGARRFLNRHGANPGEGVTVVGVEGGWSTRAITVSEDLSEVSVLVGCIASGRYSTGPRMMADTRHDEPWMGEVISGGSGLIPLRRPYSRFTAPGLALVGDAACQVFPAHGSGIGLGLIAGRTLADAVAGSPKAGVSSRGTERSRSPVTAHDPGDEQVLWAYQHEFQREYGGLLAAFDAFRRMSTALGGEGVGKMVSAGLLSEQMTRAGLDQKWQAPPPSGVPLMAARLSSVPGVAVKMLPMLVRGQLLRSVGERHPQSPDEDQLERWDHRVESLLGRLPS